MKRITNYELRITKRQEGFTLVELLVAIVVIIIVGGIITAILVSTLRGSTKATVVSDVKQNGDAALSQIARIIRSASSVDLLPCGNPSAAVNKLTVTQVDNSQTTFDCSGTTINANNTSLLDTSTVKLVPSTCSFICRQPTTADYPVIQITFSLQQANSANFVEQSATIPFQTSVLLRNTQQ